MLSSEAQTPSVVPNGTSTEIGFPVVDGSGLSSTPVGAETSLVAEQDSLPNDEVLSSHPSTNGASALVSDDVQMSRTEQIGSEASAPETLHDGAEPPSEMEVESNPAMLNDEPNSVEQALGEEDQVIALLQLLTQTRTRSAMTRHLVIAPYLTPTQPSLSLGVVEESDPFIFKHRGSATEMTQWRSGV